MKVFVKVSDDGLARDGGEFVGSTFLVIGAVLGFFGVALGAFAAHGLRKRFGEYEIGVFQTGVQYQMYHAFALFGTGLWLNFHGAQGMLSLAGWMFLAGVILFSGSLYLLALTGVRKLGAITPIGGLAFLTGWALLFIAALQ